MNRLLLAASLGLVTCSIHRAFATSGSTAPQTSAAAVQAAPAPPAPPQSPFAALIAEYIRRDLAGHSPNPEEIVAMSGLQPPPDAASIREALPLLVKALDSPDTPLRTFALTALLGLGTVPAPPAAPPDPAAAPSAPSVTAATGTAWASTPLPSAAEPGIFKPEVSRALTPAIPQIAAHLADESRPNRLLAAAILAGFTPDPPPAVYPPLLAFLRRDDAVGPVGLAVVSAILQLGPVSAESAAAITRFLRRSDQTADSRANLADLIATRPVQSQAVNQALLTYLNSDDPGLRARVILSLPQLDLAPDVFADTRSRVSVLVDNPGENLQVVNAARAVAKCWTAPRMTAGCPVY